jgi:hypothetical protein
MERKAYRCDQQGTPFFCFVAQVGPLLYPIPLESNPMLKSPACCALLIAVSLFPAGCGGSGPKLYKVKGVATHNGKPVKYLYITFTPDDLQTKALSTGACDEEGRFEMKIGSIAGVYPGKVTVSAHDPLIDMGSKTSEEPDYLAVIKKYAPGKSPMTMEIDKNMPNLELKFD